MKSTLSTVITLLLIVLFSSSVLVSQDAVVSGTVRVDATFENISINYAISQDNNRNSVLTIRYREVGSTDYQDAAITMRAYLGMVVDGEETNRNFHAGSIMFLNPDTTYELEYNLDDPDGGGSITTQFVNTKAIPQPSATANVRYVSPGDGGGNGSLSSPYLGLQEAADNAQQGDIILVSDGNYDPFLMINSGVAGSPIVFKSETLHGAIINGGDTDRGIITLGDFDMAISHIIIDGFYIENGTWGVDAQNTQFVTVRNNVIRDVDFGYVNRREDGNERDQYITNNQILGRSVWPQSGIPSERGVDIRGNNNVVSYNTIEYFGDGISTDGPPYETSYSLDIHNNDIKSIVDDLIEVDGIISNTRIYANRCFNGRAGISVAPVYGGPAYIMRNIIFNIENSALKMNRGPSGIVAVHNTAAAYDNVFESPEGWQNTYFRNNVFLASRYCFEMFGLVPDSKDDWDYGAYYSTRGGSTNTEWFKWNDIRYAQVPDLQNSGILQANAIEVAFSDFENAELPDVFPVEYDASERNFSPVVNSAVINNDAEVTHLNDAFVTDGMPDRGALEFGEEAPQYGHLFTAITFVVNTTLDVDIYPNPTVDKVMIDGQFSIAKIQLYDSGGQSVFYATGVNLPIEVDLRDLRTGAYFIHLADVSGKKRGVYTVVKK